MMAPQFTVCCLFYGDYPELAERLIKSLCRPGWLKYFKLRIACNNLSSESFSIVVAHMAEHRLPLEVLLTGTPPFYKYPIMRDLFNAAPFDTPFVMWFDDDSYVMSLAPDNWFPSVSHKLDDCVMVGAPYYKHVVGNQAKFWEAQPWHTGRPLAVDNRVNKPKVDFITGGWWTIQADILKKFDWPSPLLEHNGGDVMLGELLWQQQLKIGKFTDHLGINCDTTGKCSSASRRGFSQKPLGWDYKAEHQPLPVKPDAVVPDADWQTLIG